MTNLKIFLVLFDTDILNVSFKKLLYRSLSINSMRGVSIWRGKQLPVEDDCAPPGSHGEVLMADETVNL